MGAARRQVRSRHRGRGRGEGDAGMNPSFQYPGPCPCEKQLCRDALGIGTKLTKYGHLVGCRCRSCLGRRSKRKGQAAQAKTHKALGGEGLTPCNEESGIFYTLTVRPEVKAGKQTPASFTKFVSGEWFRHALSQSERAIPVGIDAKPS